MPVDEAPSLRWLLPLRLTLCVLTEAYGYFANNRAASGGVKTVGESRGFDGLVLAPGEVDVAQRERSRVQPRARTDGS